MTGGEWKERGTGNIKLNKHKVTGKVREEVQCGVVHECGGAWCRALLAATLDTSPAAPTARAPPLPSPPQVRVIMRQEKTLKLCANHFCDPSQELKPQPGSDRSWTWRTNADCAEGDAKPEVRAGGRVCARYLPAARALRPRTP